VREAANRFRWLRRNEEDGHSAQHRYDQKWPQNGGRHLAYITGIGRYHRNIICKGQQFRKFSIIAVVAGTANHIDELGRIAFAGAIDLQRVLAAVHRQMVRRGDASTRHVLLSIGISGAGLPALWE